MNLTPVSLPLHHTAIQILLFCFKSPAGGNHLLGAESAYLLPILKKGTFMYSSNMTR